MIEVRTRGRPNHTGQATLRGTGKNGAVVTSMSQLISPTLAIRPRPTDLASSRAVPSCLLLMTRGKDGVHPTQLMNKERYGATCCQKRQ
jgi:hypothetical protein